MSTAAAPDLQAVQAAVDDVVRSRATAQGCVLGALRRRLERAGVRLDESDLRVIASLVDRTGRTVCVATVLDRTHPHAA